VAAGSVVGLRTPCVVDEIIAAYSGVRQGWLAVERVSVHEAAARLGVSEVTIRRRLRKGDLTAEKEVTPQGYQWRILLPVTLEPPQKPDDAAPAAPMGGGDASVAVALRETIGVLERELAQRNTEIERLLTILSREQEIARAAQLQLPARTGEEDPSRTPPPDRGSVSDQASDHPQRGWWSRVVRRVIGD